MKIIHYPDPRLRQVAAPVSVFDSCFQGVAAELLAMVRDRETGALGIAAVQVGIMQRFFADRVQVYVNPEIVKQSENIKGADEGCLSHPGKIVRVVRSTWVYMKFQDVTGAEYTRKADGLVARVWQHEIDHLNGVSIVDKVLMGGGGR